jgi:hypothetical protein
MPQCEGLVVIGHLEMLQSFKNLHIDNRLMHMQGTFSREVEVLPCQLSRARLYAFFYLLEWDLELATLGMDSAPSLGKG